MITMKTPYADSCSNSGFSDRWTCPGCYDDLPNKKEGTFTCDKCGNKVKLTLDYDPVCRSQIVTDEEDEE